MSTIGQSVNIKGDLTAQEDLTIEGQVDGEVALEQNVLTVGAQGRLTAQVRAKAVIIIGKVTGNVTATEIISIRASATVEGDLVAPKLAIEEGASFQGAIDMRPAKPSR